MSICHDSLSFLGIHLMLQLHRIVPETLISTQKPNNSLLNMRTLKIKTAKWSK